jgi:hypothetical protein
MKTGGWAQRSFPVLRGDSEDSGTKTLETLLKTETPMGVWGYGKGFYPGPPCPILLRPVGGPPLKQPYSRFRDGLPALRAAWGRLLPLWTPHVPTPYVYGDSLYLRCIELNSMVKDVIAHF